MAYLKQKNKPKLDYIKIFNYIIKWDYTIKRIIIWTKKKKMGAIYVFQNLWLMWDLAEVPNGD